jgi:hypothetical protein
MYCFNKGGVRYELLINAKIVVYGRWVENTKIVNDNFKMVTSNGLVEG